MPFRYDLRTPHRALVYKSDDTTAEARELQALYDAGHPEAYQARLEELNSLRHDFRLTDGKVYEIFKDPDNFCTLVIQFQVKGSVITWGFMAPKDETYQEFRDILYGTAADAHEHVEFGCERYYRGTNAYHLKKMHTYEGEFGFNHNHYRRDDGNDITPKEVAEHLRAFSEHKHGRFFFPDPAEVEHLIAIFAEYYADYIYTGPDRPISYKEQYETDPTQKMDKEDIDEEREHIHEQEPCRVKASDIPAHKLEEMRLMRLRGIGGERADTRQLAGSERKVNKMVVKRGDVETRETPPVYSGDTYGATLFAGTAGPTVSATITSAAAATPAPVIADGGKSGVGGGASVGGSSGDTPTRVDESAAAGAGASGGAAAGPEGQNAKGFKA